jgi:hypothetical protein
MTPMKEMLMMAEMAAEEMDENLKDNFLLKD